MTYTTEFPNFDPATLPAIPADWVDYSWRNDACPCWGTPNGLRVYVDYAAPEMRDYPDTLRFTVISNDGHTSFNSDDWATIVNYVSNGGELSVNDGTLDEFILAACKAQGVDIADKSADWGGVFGIFFSGAEIFSIATAESLFADALAYGRALADRKA